MPHHLFLMELFIFSGAAIAWGLWELWSLNRDEKRAKAEAERRASEEPPRHPEG